MPPFLRSRWVWIVVAVLLVTGAGLAARFWLGGYVVRSVLRMAGASEIRHGAVRGTPGLMQVENLSFKVRSRSFAAARVTLQRESWWMASLGNVRIEGARVPVVLDQSDTDPWNWTTYDQGGLGDGPVNLPFESLDLDGELIVRMATVPDMPITVKLEGRPRTGSSWVGSLVAEGEGFRLAGGGSLLRAGQELDYQVHRAELDLAVWSRHIQRLVPLPGGPWEMGGRLTGVSEGKVTAKRFAATAQVTLRHGAMQAGTTDVGASGAEAELEFSDLWKLRTKTGTLRLAELRVGRLPFRQVTADFGLWDGRAITVNRATAEALGGWVEVGTFRYELNQRALALNLQAKGIRAPALLGLTVGVVPRFTGRVGGVLPLRIHGDGVQISDGVLALEPGSAGELQFDATALLRSGVKLEPAAEQVFKAAGRASVVLRLESLQFEIRPAGLPLGASARAQVTGTVDGTPVAFTYHVNGAVERYLRILR